jgi:predicted membrane channel-forming protein YqfA (hemolysin III family)
MPAFGYILLLNANVHQYLTVKYDDWLLTHLHLPGVWRIWLLFYGSFFLAAATILYSFFCPEEIKRYTSSFEMADRETDHHINLGQFKAVQANLNKLYDDLSDWQSSIVNSTKPTIAGVAQSSIGNANAALSVSLISLWTIRDLQRRAMRIFIYLLFALGLGLLAIPAIFTFVQVSLLAIRQL